MRNGFLLFALLVGPVSAAGQPALERTSGLDIRDVSLETALSILQRTAGVALAFSPDMLPRDRRVSCSCADLTVSVALTRILDGTGLEFVSRGSIITIGPTPDGRAQSRPGTFSGRVVGDAEGTVPIVNAVVRLDGGRSVVTGRDGAFFFDEVAPGARRVDVMALGWKLPAGTEQIVTAGDTFGVTLVLVPDAISLQGIVVVPGTFGLLDGVRPNAARTLTRREIRTVPQLGDDAFRTMSQVPGIASSDISTKLNVRGGAAAEVLVRLDGLELYEPYHVLDWDGALGIVDINALGAAELFTGGFSVRHGDKITGVLDMRSRRPEAEIKTTLGLSISNVTAANRGTFAAGRGAWVVSARRGFLDLVMDLANEGRQLSPRYHDVFAKVRYELGSSNRLSARFLYAGDRFLLRDPDIVDLDDVNFESAWDNKYGWITWEVFPGTMFSATTMAWIGRTGRLRAGTVDDADDSPISVFVSDHRDFSFGGVRSDVNLELSDAIVFEFGAEGKLLEAIYDYSRQTWTPFVTAGNTRGLRLDTLTVDFNPNGHEIGTYAALRFRAVERFAAEVGVRHDLISHTGENTLAPRLSATYEVARGTTLRASAGRYYQSHGLHELNVGDGERTYSRSTRADQLALGIDHTLPGLIGLRLEAYLRDVRGERPTFVNLEQEIKIFPSAAGDRIRFDADRGLAKGLELSLERKTSDRWTWTANYVLAFAEERVDGRWVPKQLDQRHAILLQTAYMPNRDWNISVGWRFHSGWPATSWSWSVQTLNDGWNFWTREFGPLRATRLPPYHRLDVRVNRTFAFSGGRTFQVYVDVFNVYNRTNLNSWDYSGSFEGGNLFVQRINGQEMLPFLPTFGLLYEF